MTRIFLPIVCLMTSLISSTAEAHFPWLTVNQDGKAALFFGESVADQTYKLPPSIAAAKIYALSGGKLSPLPTKSVDSDKFVGIVAETPMNDQHTLIVSKMTYGIYHGSRLNYYAMHMPGELPTTPVTIEHAKAEGLYAELVKVEEGISVTITWDGKPLVGTEVKLYCEDGHEEGASETNAQGTATFSKKEIEKGLNGITFGVTREDEAGTLDGQDYKSAMHYATITFIQQ